MVIEERLRERANNHSGGDETNPEGEPIRLLREAADEIDRIRNELRLALASFLAIAADPPILGTDDPYLICRETARMAAELIERQLSR